MTLIEMLSKVEYHGLALSKNSKNDYNASFSANIFGIIEVSKTDYTG